jgi:hypothetical protein
MDVSQLHLARKAVSLAAVAAALATLSGCQGIVSTPVLSQVRVIDTSPDAPGLDIYQGTGAVAYNLGFGTITSYVPTTPGTYSISANSAGTSQVLVTSKNTFALDTQYTVLIGNSAASLQETIFKDQSQAAPVGQVSLRFLAQSTHAGGVDIYLVPAGQKITAVSPLFTNLTFGINTGYLNVPTGTYTIVMVPTGTVPNTTTIAMYNGPQVAYTDGSASTIVLIDQQVVTSPGLQVITARDYESPTATN